MKPIHKLGLAAILLAGSSLTTVAIAQESQPSTEILQPNSAKSNAPGQTKSDGASASQNAPGQMQNSGEVNAAKDAAPGQVKSSSDTTSTDKGDKPTKSANDNSAKDGAPGQNKTDGNSAKSNAPGQTKTDGSSAKDKAPGQTKSSQTETDPDQPLTTDEANNSAKEYAPGQNKTDGQSASDQAPGQMQNSGEVNAAKDAAPGQMKQDQASDTNTSDETTASVNITTEQTTEIREIIRETNVKPVSVDIDLRVGIEAPRTIEYHTLPPRFVEIVPAYRGYDYFVLVDGRIVIVEPSTYRVVYILSV